MVTAPGQRESPFAPTKAPMVEVSSQVKDVQQPPLIRVAQGDHTFLRQIKVRLLPFINVNAKELSPKPGDSIQGSLVVNNSMTFEGVIRITSTMGGVAPSFVYAVMDRLGPAFAGAITVIGINEKGEKVYITTTPIMRDFFNTRPPMLLWFQTLSEEVGAYKELLLFYSVRVFADTDNSNGPLRPVSFSVMVGGKEIPLGGSVSIEAEITEKEVLDIAKDIMVESGGGEQ